MLRDLEIIDHLKIIDLIAMFHYSKIYTAAHLSGWPSGLRRQFKALVFGRGFESHFGQ
jgi:hypothetical protein